MASTFTHPQKPHTHSYSTRQLAHSPTHSLTHLLTHQTLTPPLSNPKTQFSLAIGTKPDVVHPKDLPQGTNKKQFQLQACCIPSHPRAFHPHNVRPLNRQKNPHCLPLPPSLPSPLPSPFHYLGIDFNGASTTNLPWPHPIFLPRYTSHPIPPSHVDATTATDPEALRARASPTLPSPKPHPSPSSISSQSAAVQPVLFIRTHEKPRVLLPFLFQPHTKHAIKPLTTHSTRQIDWQVGRQGRRYW